MSIDFDIKQKTANKVCDKSTLQVLKEARELISDPDRWTQKHYARDHFGNPVEANSDRANCWCSIGAVGKVTNDGHGNFHPAIKVLDSRIVSGVGVVKYNDTKTHSEVLELFDAAIEKLERKQT